MAQHKTTRDETQERRERPAVGKHRGSRWTRRVRVPAGGRHVRMMEPAQPSGTR